MAFRREDAKPSLAWGGRTRASQGHGTPSVADEAPPPSVRGRRPGPPTQIAGLTGMLPSASTLWVTP